VEPESSPRLKDRDGKKLIHQRCTIPQARHIQRYLPKKYRKEAHRHFKTALEPSSYNKDAKKMLKDFEAWLRGAKQPRNRRWDRD
jgi:transposase-like protein